ncbi:uncharacterized protein LOC122299025 [Carya illinoinensis]|uniref:uncharacterized protein LOC122299025 n=1 Tax=Carya illinoinensis TaxID=32201 RepID=UPI001C7274AB|nr:uncharacterized protein LOC122299025 [Carya illinoinensis]
MEIEFNGKYLWISFVYAKCNYGEHRRLWDDLCSLQSSNVPRMVIGDFNIIRSDEERIGGRPRPRIAMEEFNSFIDMAGLSELGFQGNNMTWCNGHEGRSQSWARLDRALVNLAHVLEFPSVGGIYLPKLSSDHAILQVDLSLEDRRYDHVPFTFQQMWTTQDTFMILLLMNGRRDMVVVGYSSPGPDGFKLVFYKACWDIVGTDVVDGVKGGKILREFTASFFVLIPKVDNPKSFDKFRPISMCSVFYKICTKILVSRLSSLLPQLISKEQGAFILGRSIFENVSLTQEMIQNINKPVRGGNVVLKIDMAKAYDMVIQSRYGQFLRFLQFMKASLASGVNKEKSLIIFSNLIPYFKSINILRIFGFSEGSLSFKYLGVPIVSRRLKAVHFDEFLGKIGDKIGGWQSWLLSSGARLLLLKHVLGSFSIHVLSILQVPKSILSSISRSFSNLFWGYKDGRSTKHWKSWELMCKPVKEGGIGIQNLDKNHISSVNPNKGYRFWKMVMRSLPDVIDQSKWKPMRGNISFWLDKWIGDEPLVASFPIISSDIKLKDCCRTSGWDTDLLVWLVGCQKAQEISFTLHRPRDGADHLIWMAKDDGNFSSKSAWEVTRIKTPKWRGLFGRGVPCKWGSSDINIAHGWKLSLLGLPKPPCLHSRVKLWVLFLLLWKRCKPFQVVWWNCPGGSWVKLNVDGSSRETLRKAGAGGLIHDSSGNLVLAFSIPFDFGTNNYAEFMSLLHGVRHLSRLGFRNVEIEMDSIVVVN